LGRKNRKTYDKNNLTIFTKSPKKGMQKHRKMLFFVLFKISLNKHKQHLNNQINKYNLLIADAHYLVREGLKSIFEAENEFNVCSEVENYDSIIDEIIKNNPDVIILGMNIQGVSIIPVVGKILETFPSKKILVLDTNEDTTEIVTLLRMGVHGYILKHCDREEILDAVKAMVVGKTFFCSNVIKLNKKNLTIDDNHNSSIQLSEREIEVLELISQGLTNNEIAEKMFLSTHTVASHRKNLMRKLNARNNVDLVISAIKEKFIIPKI
jgi:DNA-binding NarL/FixJ family response regulator